MRTFCSAGTKIPRHLLQKKMNTTTMGRAMMNTTMKITCCSPHSSNRIQPLRLDRGQGIRKTFLPQLGGEDLPRLGGEELPQLGGEEASEGFKTHLPLPPSPCNSQISHTYEYELRTPGFKVKSSPSWNSQNGAVGVGLNQTNPR